jgi:hypothetical protein
VRRGGGAGLNGYVKSSKAVISTFNVRELPEVIYVQLCTAPRVEAGKNTSSVIPASRKRRRKENPVVSDETVLFGYESSATLITDRLHYKLQTRHLVRHGRILPP